ncbi:hypothetical protein TREMEDRAFT_62002 [Tremella mesenterica DSM 1558]|uniref:uncharacterized protein n=1 Tax=Tremella mesenterica (strain ATCC 24925 / CBS 8224 / DSM 1558 / NBRC 9311 / NRRL Y-6157 / RJB 2259-6 / UBC 559-6) TaxID=578456 RepID=UPI0003F4A230|nr:uncharacterized protein TREMEDRAFT_62002 [Tremella mesenterica DSM 1558]EIW70241.1 hypothetical protein TREMEDRAFT_62002 [Tremella mesenterica DSM 1558]
MCFKESTGYRPMENGAGWFEEGGEYGCRVSRRYDGGRAIDTDREYEAAAGNGREKRFMYSYASVTIAPAGGSFGLDVVFWQSVTIVPSRGNFGLDASLVTIVPSGGNFGLSGQGGKARGVVGYSGPLWVKVSMRCWERFSPRYSRIGSCALLAARDKLEVMGQFEDSRKQGKGVWYLVKSIPVDVPR